MMEELSPNNAGQDEDVATTPKPSSGRMLREARERLGLSVADVTEQTKLSHRQVEALEADDFQRLPELPFVRGFVRSYAKILHLDAQPLLAALPQAKEASAKRMPASVEVPFPNAQLSQRQNRIWLGAAFLLAVGVAFAMWYYTPPLGESEVTQVETPVSLPAQMPAMPAPPVAEVEVVVPPAPTATQSSAEEVQAPAMAAKPQIPTALPQTQAASSAVPPVVPSRPAVLRLTFDEESWAEIKDKDDQILSSQVNPSGTELRLNGQAPFSLVIGRAASVRLYYRGKQVDLTPHIHATSEVARLTLE